MQKTKLMWDMPISLKILDRAATPSDLDSVFSYFRHIDEIFNTFKPESEISRLNLGKINQREASSELQTVLALCEQTHKDSDGYFDIHQKGKLDPLGLVKGWAVNNAAINLKKRGLKNFFIEAGGDIAVSGLNHQRQPWKVGIRNPFNRREIVKTILLTEGGVATSGTYIRGQHITNPKIQNNPLDQIVSLTVIGPNIYEADRFATAAFAMQGEGINFIEKQSGLAGYSIDVNGLATMTSNFTAYLSKNA